MSDNTEDVDFQGPLEDEEVSETPSRRKISRWAIGFTAAVALLGIGSATTFLFLHQPVTAESQKPAKTDLTETVEKRALVSKVVTRGTVTSVGATDVSCVPSSAGTQAKVFTKTPEKGKALNEGDALAAVNGRPVLVMQGAAPAFRDMLPGTTGPDVEQLQAALGRLGHSITDKAGTLGPSTQAALTKLYTNAGFVATAPTPEQANQLRQAQDTAADAESAVTKADLALKEAKKGPPKSQVLGAKQRVADAERQFADAPPELKEKAGQDLEIARASYDEMIKGADVAGPTAAYQDAVKARDRAKDALAQISSTTGTSVPYCEIVFLPSLPASVAQAQTSLDPAGSGNPNGPGGQGQGQGGGAPQGGAGWATLAPGSLSLRSELSETERKLITKGAQVNFRSDSESTERTGKVDAIDDKGVTIVPDQPFPEEERGQNVRVSISIEATSGEVLVVPLSAVSGTADGLARVSKLDGSNKTDVPVRAGLTADGFVEVTPVTEGALKVGDSVVVGR